MEDFEFLCEYFEEYKDSSSDKKKREIEDKFLKLIFSGGKKSFTSTRNKQILFGDFYEKDFNITHKQKILFVKYCVHKMFEKFLTEEEYEIESERKKQKRAFELEYKFLWDTPSFDYRIEEYFHRTVFFELCNNKYKFNNPRYFQCQECGGFFLKSKNKKITNQKYCLDCKIVVSKKLARKRSKKYYHATKSRKI